MNSQRNLLFKKTKNIKIKKMENDNETNYVNSSNSRELVGTYTNQNSSYQNSNEIKESNKKQTQEKQSK